MGRKYKYGDLVLISDRLNHDVGYQRQIGIVMGEYDYGGKQNTGLSDYSVLAYDTRACRYWVCGFEEKDLQRRGNIFELLRSYNHWGGNEKYERRKFALTRPYDIVLLPLEDLQKIKTQQKDIINTTKNIIEPLSPDDHGIYETINNIEIMHKVNEIINYLNNKT